MKHKVVSWQMMYMICILSCGGGGENRYELKYQEQYTKSAFYYTMFFFFFVFSLFRAAPMAYGVSQARGPIGATATGLCHSHSNAESEPHL